ncbi:MAG: hypothetical protein Q9M26_03665 [Mariprofundales bacterium]|nr:hypothetical protein [Mariprofundales bacterium]
MTLHILEPTLINDSGHCYTVARALIDVAVVSEPVTPIHLWAGRQAEARLIDLPTVQLTPCFSRKLRRIQLHFLLRRLLRAGESVFVLTASRAELFSYAMIPKALRQRGNAVFYVHQMRMDAKRLRRLQWIARRAPEMRILTTTEALAQSISQAGFAQVRCQPYPLALPEALPATPPFRHLLFPGMARMDKNLALVAEVIGRMHQRGCTIPVHLQAAPNHHGEFAPDVAALLQKIRHIGYPHLTMPEQAVDGAAYLDQFRGAICLQPFHRDQYADKVSGITLDALGQACPVVVRSRIWAATMVTRYDAGAVVDGDDANIWLDAIIAVIADYPRYQANCCQAYAELRQQHDPARLFAAIMDTV